MGGRALPQRGRTPPGNPNPNPNPNPSPNPIPNPNPNPKLRQAMRTRGIPSVGLDPPQLREALGAWLEFSQRKTVAPN